MSNLATHEAEQAALTALCEAGTCGHAECAPVKRRCLFCGQSADQIHDSATSRAYQCHSCLALEWITKGRTSWWYHGAQALDNEDKPGARIDGDGRRKQVAPIHFERWAQLACEGDLSAVNW